MCVIVLIVGQATKWHDDFNSFKRGVKDLEVMMQNVINSAFECVSTVAGKFSRTNLWRITYSNSSGS